MTPLTMYCYGTSLQSQWGKQGLCKCQKIFPCGYLADLNNSHVEIRSCMHRYWKALQLCSYKLWIWKKNRRLWLALLYRPLTTHLGVIYMIILALVDMDVWSIRQLVDEWIKPCEMRFCDDSADSNWCDQNSVTLLMSEQFVMSSQNRDKLVLLRKHPYIMSV